MPTHVDDPTIGDDEVLWRRIRPEWVQREQDGTIRPASVAFIDRTPSREVSVHIASLTDQDRVLQAYPEDSLVAIKAGHPRSLGYAIVRDPTPEDPSHALICPSPNKGDARKIAKQYNWVLLRDTPSA